MAYIMFGGSPADFFIDATGTPIPFATATVWTAESGGSQVTDLLSESGAAQTGVVADSFGGFRFQAPDTYGTLWLDSGAPDRYVIHPTLTGTRVKALEQTSVTLDVNGKVPAGYLPPALAPADGLARKAWFQPTAPTSAQGAADGDVWFQLP